MARAESLLAAALSAQEPRKPFIEPGYSDRELLELARQESYVPLDQIDFRGHQTATVLSRLIACIIDGFILTMTFAVGCVATAWLIKLGVIDQSIGSMRLRKGLSFLVICSSSSLTMAIIIAQWYLLATAGQTIGKKLMMIRIVTINGRLPGFFQAVVLRNWLRYLLGIIPFFSIVDLLCGLSDSRRCLHDYLSGTRVVDVA
jgi:uncharacterized RDD family membrane protein YckC